VGLFGAALATLARVLAGVARFGVVAPLAALLGSPAGFLRLSLITIRLSPLLMTGIMEPIIPQGCQKNLAASSLVLLLRVPLS
jgi:hypothetical protein